MGRCAIEGPPPLVRAPSRPMPDSDTATLLIHCPDQPGLVHDVTGFIFSHRGNINDLEQHIAPLENLFFMRVEWSLENFTLEKEEIDPRFSILGHRHQMGWKLHFASERKRLAIFVSKESHCLYDLLSRHEAGELDADIPLVISNHESLRLAAERFGVPFHCIAVTKENKSAAEAQQRALVEEHRVDTIVL